MCAFVIAIEIVIVIDIVIGIDIGIRWHTIVSDRIRIGIFHDGALTLSFFRREFLDRKSTRLNSSHQI